MNIKVPKKQIICIIGKSGSGKSTIANWLKNKFNLNILPSYTTRAKRVGEQDGVEHKFISRPKFIAIMDSGDMVAYTKFNGKYYGATKEQLFINDIYIIDTQGLQTLRYNKDIDVISIYIDVPLFTRIKRMFQRGDSIKSIISRVIHDRTAFAGAGDMVDYVIPNKYLPTTLAKASFVLNGLIKLRDTEWWNKK